MVQHVQLKRAQKGHKSKRKAAARRAAGRGRRELPRGHGVGDITERAQTTDREGEDTRECKNEVSIRRREGRTWARARESFGKI